MQRPVIAVLMDYESQGSFSSRPHYALRTGYFSAIERAGGIPIAIPYLASTTDAILSLAQAVVIPGGFYDFPPPYYGEPADHNTPPHPRSQFEDGFTREILKRDIPLLGICAGMQVLGAVMGATLFRDVHKVLETTTDHLNGKPAEQTAHPVSITPGTRLHAIVEADRIDVNTAHNEALDTIPDTITVNAVADDGVIEGIEIPGYRFALGVQWHPEFFQAAQTANQPHKAIFEALIEAAHGDHA